MPELPEVETIRLQLSQLIIGLTVKNIEIISPKSFIGDPKLLLGSKISNLRRFAKLLVIDFDSLPRRQAGQLSLAVHLKMTGQLIFRNPKSEFRNSKLTGEDYNYTRVIVAFTNGDRLFFNDMRRFGWMKVLRKLEAGSWKIEEKNIPLLNTLISKLGPDPLSELTLERFKEVLKSTKKPIKLVLMDQEKIGGVGNIYANEALFLAGIHPKKRANELTGYRVKELLKRLKQVLTDGVKWGGASRLNFRDAYGNKGKVQEHFLVYDREGESCLNRCGVKIQKIKLGGRGTYFCPRCQL